MTRRSHATVCSRPSNPFSTRFVHPGAIPYQFEPGAGTEQLVRRLADFNGRGQIIGPHGSGKSTLLASLAEPVARCGRPMWIVALHDGARQMPSGWARRARSAGASVIAVDGYEQLDVVARWLLKIRCARYGWGLLITAHRDAGLPTIHRTSFRLETAQAIAARLQAGHALKLGPEVVAKCFAAAGGDVRETLFALYDRWEVQSRLSHS